MPLHAVCAHPVQVIGLALILEEHATKDIQHVPTLADGVPHAQPAAIVNDDSAAALHNNALSSISFAAVLHERAHL